MSDPSCARHREHSSTFIVSESLFPIRSHGEYYLKVPLWVSVESTSRGSPTHYPRRHPCKSQPAKSKSQPANTKVSRRSSDKRAMIATLSHIQCVRLSNHCHRCRVMSASVTLMFIYKYQSRLLLRSAVVATVSSFDARENT
jgi:hypothetical protein